MKLEIAQKMVGLMNDRDIEAEIFENYSGRGMFGKKTTGIRTNVSGMVVGYFYALAMISIFGEEWDNTMEAPDFYDTISELENEDVIANADFPRHSDSLGLEMIYY